MLKKNFRYNSNIFVQCAISESARPFSFLNGVHNKWCKLDFELYEIHTKTIAFYNTFAHVPSKSQEVVNNWTIFPLQMKDFFNIKFSSTSMHTFYKKCTIQLFMLSQNYRSSRTELFFV